MKIKSVVQKIYFREIKSNVRMVLWTICVGWFKNNDIILALWTTDMVW